jgi:hypothetical protein
MIFDRFKKLPQSDHGWEAMSEWQRAELVRATISYHPMIGQLERALVESGIATEEQAEKFAWALGVQAAGGPSAL